MAAHGKTWRTSWPVVGLGGVFVLIFLGLAVIDQSHAQDFRHHRDVAEARVIRSSSSRGSTTFDVVYESASGDTRHAALDHAHRKYSKGETLQVWYSNYSQDAVTDLATGGPVPLYTKDVIWDLTGATAGLLVSAAGYLVPANLRRLDRRDARRGHWRQARPSARHG